MALDENDIKQIGELIANATKPKETPAPAPAPAPKPEDKSVVDKAKEKEAADKLRATELQDTEFATKFEIGFEAFKKDNKDYLPEELDYILSTVDALKIENKVQKVKEIKSAIMELFFNKEKNLNVLNETQKSKAKAFAALTRDAKRESANQYWEVLEIAVDNLHQGAKLQSALKTSGYAANNGQDKYADSVFGRSAQLNIPAKNAVVNK